MIEIKEVAHKGKIMGCEIHVNGDVYNLCREYGLRFGEFPRVYDYENLMYHEYYKKVIFSSESEV